MSPPTRSVSVHNVTKRFGAVVACDEVSIELHPGEMHGVLGENGAGKSTLMKMLIGLVLPDAGEIRVGGDVAFIDDPAVGGSLGVGMVHQHFSLVDELRVWENVMLGRPVTPRSRAALARPCARSRHATASTSTPTPGSVICPSGCANGSRSSSACGVTRASSSSTSRRRC